MGLKQHFGSDHILNQSIVEIIAECLFFKFLMIDQFPQKRLLLAQMLFHRNAFGNFIEESHACLIRLDSHPSNLSLGSLQMADQPDDQQV